MKFPNLGFRVEEYFKVMVSDGHPLRTAKAIISGFYSVKL